MNQDQVKKLLLSIEEPSLEFSVVFSGKKSQKVNGLYKPQSREIIIHNHNFTDDNMLMYTAIHEYAHHLHACTKGGRITGRAHTAEFWSILHGLLQVAEEKGAYKNVFATSSELEALTATIKKQYLYENGNLVKELGKLLLQASEICRTIGARFEDYIDRVLCIPRVAAKVAMKSYQYNVNPSMGADNMKLVASIRNSDTRATAEAALLSGKSPDEVRVALRAQPKTEDPRTQLEKEKIRLEKTISTLTRRLEEVEQALQN